MALTPGMLSRGISATNSEIQDKLVELSNGASGTPSGDSGIIIERGTSTNVFIGWDESTDKVTVATTSATGASTGDLSLTDADFACADITSSGNASCIGVASASKLTVDQNFTGTTTATTKGAHIDFDATGITASGQTATNIGLDLDMNSETVTMVGAVNNTGIDVDLVAATSGVQTNIGIDVAVSGADTNYAAVLNGGNVGIGTSTPTAALHVAGSAAFSGPSKTFVTFSSSDVTPSVATGNLFKTHASSQALSMFDNGVAGQTITVISTAAVTFDVTGTNLKGGSADIVTADGDVTSWTFDGTYWYLQQFMDVSANQATAAGGGKILQVVHVLFTGLFASTSTTFADVAAGSDTLEASITPSADTSTILIQVSVNLSVKYQAHGYWRIWNGSAAISGGVADSAHSAQESGLIFSARTDWHATSSTQVAGYATMVLDSPETTSSVTYTIQAKSSSSAPVTVNRNTRNSNVLVDSPGISSITLFEIGA